MKSVAADIIQARNISATWWSVGTSSCAVAVGVGTAEHVGPDRVDGIIDDAWEVSEVVIETPVFLNDDDDVLNLAGVWSLTRDQITQHHEDYNKQPLHARNSRSCPLELTRDESQAKALRWHALSIIRVFEEYYSQMKKYAQARDASVV